MMKFITGAAVMSAALIAAPAMAQSTDQARFYGGASVGYHSLDDSIVSDVEGAIYGGIAGVDIPAGETLMMGVEANYHAGTADIDSEYGIAAKLGVRVGDAGQLFVKGGYQEVDFDLDNILGAAVPAGLDDTDGDYLVGVGGEFPINDKVSFRAGVDTIAFDSTRATMGVVVKF